MENNKTVQIFCEQVVNELFGNRGRGVASHLAGSVAVGVAHNVAHDAYVKQKQKAAKDFGEAFYIGLGSLAHKIKWFIPVQIFGVAMVALYKRTISKFKECNKKHGQIITPEANAQCRLTHSKNMLNIAHKMAGTCGSVEDAKRDKCKKLADREIEKWTKFVTKYEQMIKHYY